MEVESQSQEDSSQTLNVVEHQKTQDTSPSKEKCKFCLIVTFKPYCDSLSFHFYRRLSIGLESCS